MIRGTPYGRARESIIMGRSPTTSTREGGTVPAAGAAGHALRVGILGDLIAERDGARLPLGGLQQRSVVALLVLARGQVLLAERLIDDLWGESPPASATATLHSYVSRLRTVLNGSVDGTGAATPALVRQGPGYRLDVAADSVDSDRFERTLQDAAGMAPQRRLGALSGALALWRGPALADFRGRAWADAAGARLDGLREVARDQLLAARLDNGDAAVLVPELERLVAEDPLREERWRLLAVALYRSARQADALGALRRARDVLADELGVDPGAALRQLEADVLAQAPSLDVAAQPLSTVEPSPSLAVPATARPPRPTEPIMERDRELRELAHAVGDAAGGRGGIVLLEGPAGIGKTRLLEEARRLATEEGLQPATARGSQLERGYGFGVVRQLLEPFLVGGGGARHLRDHAAAASVVFDADPAGSAVPTDGFGVLNGLYWLVADLAGERPLLLSIDDLQWCDASSLRFLTFLAGRLEQLPVVVVATLRTGETATDDDLLADIGAAPAAVVVRPGPLSGEAVAGLVRQRLGDEAAPTFTAACARTTGGNPLLLRQLLRALESERVRPDAAHADTVTAIGSRAISSTVVLRLRRLPAPASEVARAIAVLGEDAALPAVSALAEVAEEDVNAAVGVLARAEILRASHPLGFVHPLVAEAVYRDLAPGDRARAHDRAARILASAGAPAEQVAAHLLLTPARGDAWVVTALTAAAERAQAHCAPEAAAAYLTRAVAEPASEEEIVGLLVSLAQVAGLSDGPAAQRSLERAYELATDPMQRAEIALVLTSALVFLGPQGAATRFALRAATELPVELVDVRQAMIAIGRIAGWIHQLPVERWLDAEPAPIVGGGVGSRMLAVEQAWQLCVRGVDRARALDLVRTALADTEWLESDHDLFHDMAGIALMVADEDTEAFWVSALDRAHARGEVLTVGMHLWRGAAQWRRGDLREALQSLVTARHQTEEWGSDQIGVPYCEALMTMVQLDLADVAGARRRLDAALENPGIGDPRRLLYEAEAAVLLAEGRAADALRAVEAVLRDQDGLANPAWYTARALKAEILLALGQRAQAIAVVEKEVVAARRWGARGPLGRLLRQLAVAQGEPSGAAAAREAVALLADHPAQLERARALVGLAHFVDEVQERISLLTQAFHDASACDAAGLVDEITAALDRAGAAPPADATRRTSLTRLERQCVALTADGLDSAAVARRLFVTPRTVIAALASARQRLGVDSDAEVAAAVPVRSGGSHGPDRRG